MASNNPKNADWYGTHQAAILGEVVGSIFYVHGSNGSDVNNDGLTPISPFLSIQHAMNQCTAWADDYIFVISYPEESTTEAMPIQMDVEKVHLIGTTKQASPSPAIVNAAGNSIEVTVSNVEIAGFTFAAEAASACIECSGDLWQVHIHHNDFAWTKATQDCITWPTGQSANAFIHHNRFGAHGFTQYGIHTVDSAGRMVISDNFFKVVSGDIGIYLQAGGFSVLVERNTFSVADAADGEAITVGNVIGSLPGLFNNNYAGQGVESLDNNPYLDTGGHNWGLNYSGLVPTYPVIA